MYALTNLFVSQVGTSSTAPGEMIGGAVDMLGQAYHSHNWALVAAALLTITVAILRLFNIGSKIPGPYVPWLTLGMSMAMSAVVGLQAGLPMDQILGTGLLIGVAAIGGWESVAKLIRNLIAMVSGGGGSAPQA